MTPIEELADMVFRARLRYSSQGHEHTGKQDQEKDFGTTDGDTSDRPGDSGCLLEDKGPAPSPRGSTEGRTEGALGEDTRGAVDTVQVEAVE